MNLTEKFQILIYVKIKSISDVRTNSSSETFVFKLDDPLYEKAKAIEEFDEYPTLDSIKKIVLNEYYSGWENEYSDEIYDGPTPVNDIFSDYEIDKTEENWEKYKNLYEPLVGNAFLMIDRDSNKCSEIKNILYQDYIKREIIPIVEKLKIGKRYSIRLNIYGPTDPLISFIWKGKPDIIVEGGYRKKPTKENIITILCLSVLDTLHED